MHAKLRCYFYDSSIFFRTDKLQKSGFDHDQNVRPVNGALPDAAIGFDNSLYYEIRQPEAVEGLPNGKY